MSHGFAGSLPTRMQEKIPSRPKPERDFFFPFRAQHTNGTWINTVKQKKPTGQTRNTRLFAQKRRFTDASLPQSNKTHFATRLQMLACCIFSCKKCILKENAFPHVSGNAFFVHKRRSNWSTAAKSPKQQSSVATNLLCRTETIKRPTWTMAVGAKARHLCFSPFL